MTTNLTNPAIDSCCDDVIIGDSPAAVRLRLQIARIAPHFRIALLTGEPGSGKHAIARHMHAASPAAARAFTIIPAAEFAEGNRPTPIAATIYLPSLEALDPLAQVHLLRMLKTLDRETRVILASRSDLKGMASAGRLRADLYERVGTLQIRVTPLRERLDDLDPIAHRMLRRLTKGATLSDSVLTRMRQHSWPGNLRELAALCERLAPLRFILDASDLEPYLPRLSEPQQAAPATRLEHVMQRHVMDVLEGCSGNKLRSAELLGISRSTLYRMLESSSIR
jgi:DNA-binding NtrC family response regulator